jgi:hypothetical protein
METSAKTHRFDRMVLANLGFDVREFPRTQQLLMKVVEQHYDNEVTKEQRIEMVNRDFVLSSDEFGYVVWELLEPYLESVEDRDARVNPAQTHNAEVLKNLKSGLSNRPENQNDIDRYNAMVAYYNTQQL